MKKWISALAAASLCLGFTGCASSSVTVENAPTEILKSAAAIGETSSPQDVTDVFNQLIDVTASAYGHQIVFSISDSGTTLDTEADELTTKEYSQNTYDVRYAADDAVYQLYEQNIDGKQQAGLMMSNSTTTDTMFADFKAGSAGSSSQTLDITSVSTAPADESVESDSDWQDVFKNTVIYPLYSMSGASLIIQPAIDPGYYTFKLTKSGSDYVWTISIKDKEAYNEELDQQFESAYGYPRRQLDEAGEHAVEMYNTEDVSLILTMDENGVLKKITNKSSTQAGNEDEPFELSTEEVTRISQAGQGWLDFFEDTFQKVENGEYKEGVSFQLNTASLNQQ